MRKNRKQEKIILICVAVFYILVTLLAVAILSIKGSIFAERVNFRNSTVEKDDPNFREIEQEREMAPEQEYEDDIFDEPATEETVEATEATEATEEEIPEEEPVDEGPEYYGFIANNTDGRLNVRKEPSIKAKIIYRLHPGDKGYVIATGDEWTYVSVSDKTGYIASEYLSLREISEDEFPEELKPLVEEGMPTGEEDEAAEEEEEETNPAVVPGVTDQAVIQ